MPNIVMQKRFALDKTVVQTFLAKALRTAGRRS